MLEEKISDRQLLEIKQDDREFPRSIIMPLKIVYKGGFYYLESKDYLLNKIIEVPITGVGEAYEGEAKIVQSLPRFDETGGKHLRFYSVNKIELEKLDSGKFWRIKYKDFHDNVSQRTIYNCSFLLSKETNAEGDAVDVDYIKANCLLRNKEERFFRIDRIQAIEVLGLEVTPVLK
ncbi:MAG: hypothetical protein EOP48_17490 [Sphingobacteriales bacterium]|nr:MAG: hypothetical protein EOP48_17490 [Sphingobacteriales bacterium]